MTGAELIRLLAAEGCSEAEIHAATGIKPWAIRLALSPRYPQLVRAFNNWLRTP